MMMSDYLLLETIQVPRAVWTYLHRSTLVLAHHPTPEAVTAEAFVLKTNGCHKCARRMPRYMVEISVLFGRAIKNAIEQVSL